MINLPTAETFNATIADPRFAAMVAISFLAGIVRGFSGFGSALIYIPLMSAVYGPLIAAPTFVVADLVTGFTFLSRTWRKAHWREILPMAAAAIGAAQFGTLILQHTNPIALRWAVSALVALIVIVLASGWRYRGEPSLPLTICVGLLSGALGGAVQISGPPIILYWMGSAHPADIIRANFFGYFSLFSAASVATYAVHGLLTATVLMISVFVTPLTMLGMAAGSYLFGFASENVYRRVGYAVVAFSALISMPLFDRFLR